MKDTTHNQKISKFMLKEFFLSDLKIKDVSDRDLDLLIRTHPQIVNAQLLEKSDVKHLLEGPWHMAREDIFSGKSQKELANTTSHRVAFGLQQQPNLMHGGPPMMDCTLNDRL